MSVTAAPMSQSGQDTAKMRQAPAGTPVCQVPPKRRAARLKFRARCFGSKLWVIPPCLGA
jgi:hypothetical protein